MVDSLFQSPYHGPFFSFYPSSFVSYHHFLPNILLFLSLVLLKTNLLLAGSRGARVRAAIACSWAPTNASAASTEAPSEATQPMPGRQLQVPPYSGGSALID
jgi:hypothetical protein